MSLILDMLRPDTAAARIADADAAIGVISSPAAVRAFPSTTDAALAIMRIAQHAVFTDDADPAWISGYRALTRACAMLECRQFPGDPVYQLHTVKELTTDGGAL